MSTTSTILPASAAQDGRGAARLFTATTVLTFAVTGIGLFEGHVVYPSWYDLAGIDDFAAYHVEFGRRLIPWLPVPLAIATVLNGLLIRWCPPAIPRRLVATTFALQLLIAGVTVVLAIPLQAELSTPGHSPAEIVGMLDRLTRVSWLRDVPGVAIAGAFVWMTHHQLGWSPRRP